ncbi:MAG: cupredoxin domain-containing protein [Solirubrobacteraceae bacterium]
MRKPIVLATVSVATAVLAVPALAATKSVKVGDNYYVKDNGVPTVTVKKGDTVKWNFVGEYPHTVTVRSGPVKFTSKTLRSGVFTKKVTKPGTYRIYCKIHGAKDQSMVLKVR